MLKPNGERHLTQSQYAKERKRRFNSCAACFKRFDDLIMKPIMIFRYDQELIKKKDEFVELFMKEGEMWEKLYMHEEPMEAFEDVRSQRGNSVMRHIGSVSQRRSIVGRNTLLHSNLSNGGRTAASNTAIERQKIAYRSPKLDSNRSPMMQGGSRIPSGTFGGAPSVGGMTGHSSGGFKNSL